MIDRYLSFARENKASDVHVTVGLPLMMRITGKLRPIDDRILGAEDTYQLIKHMLNPEQIRHLEAGNDLDFAYQSEDGLRNRVNIYMQKGSYSAAIRLLNPKIPTIEELGLPPVIKELTNLKRGLILVTGPTGSGKSTTLAAMINEINKTRKEHILTLEDPIEYVHNHNKSMVNQREVGIDTKSFDASLRSALREDPDVILVGEMRDYETISLALTAAETGHLVLSTLHTTSATQTIDRIIDVFPPNQQQQIRLQLSIALRGVIAQHLIPTVDGINRCAALEIMLNNDASGNMIREGKTYQISNVIQTGVNEGMQSLDYALAKLVAEGKITEEVALDTSSDPENLKRLMQNIGATIKNIPFESTF